MYARSRGFLSVLSSTFEGAGISSIRELDSRPQPMRISSSGHIPHRLRSYVDTESPVDFNLPENALTDMLTERLQELISQKISTAENLIEPSSEASQVLNEEQFLQAAPETAGVSGDRAFIPTLGKVLTRVGCCSRKESSAMISSGKVSVNGKVITEAFFVCRPEDTIHVVGIKGRLRFSPPRLWIYHKPRFVSSSTFDSQGRKVLMAHASRLGFDHIIPVCRLPYSQHGLMLLTNDGSLSSFIEHPSTQLQHVYRMRVAPSIDPLLAQRLTERGVDIDGVRHDNYIFSVDPRRSKNFVKIRVRGEEIPVFDVLKSLGRSIKRGGRTGLGPFSLETLPVGSTREVTIPSSYFQHIGDHWRPFVERDWPFFRRKRIQTLRALGKARVLNQREMEELDVLSSEEVKQVSALKPNTLLDDSVITRPLINVPMAD